MPSQETNRVLNRYLETGKYSISSHIYRSTGRWHGGIDLTAARATDIPAAAAGTVVYSGQTEHPTCRNLVIIKSAGPRGACYTLYAHMDAPSPLYEGQVIQAGDLVGNVGNTGHIVGEPGYHLHLEVLGGNNNVNSYYANKIHSTGFASSN